MPRLVSIFLAVGLAAADGCSRHQAAKTETPATETSRTATAKAETPSESEKPVPAKSDARPVVVMQTSAGDIRIELWADKAPRSVENFLGYVDAGFYDGTIFHRVMDGFMIQGGGFTPQMEQKPARAAIRNEASAELKNLRGTIAMARTGQVHSATAQFFISVVDNPFLDHRDESPQGFGYAVFGQVVEGMDVVDKIRKVATATRHGQENVPVTPVVIQSVRRAGAQTK